MPPPVELREFYNVEKHEKMPRSERWWNMFKSNPAPFIGGVGCLSMVAYAVHNFKNRKSSASMYVMHYRVLAQFMFIGAMFGSVVGVSVYSTIYGNPNDKKAIEGAPPTTENGNKKPK